MSERFGNDHFFNLIFSKKSAHDERK